MVVGTRMRSPRRCAGRSTPKGTETPRDDSAPHTRRRARRDTPRPGTRKCPVVARRRCGNATANSSPLRYVAIASARASASPRHLRRARARNAARARCTLRHAVASGCVRSAAPMMRSRGPRARIALRKRERDHAAVGGADDGVQRVDTQVVGGARQHRGLVVAADARELLPSAPWWRRSRPGSRSPGSESVGVERPSRPHQGIPPALSQCPPETPHGARRFRPGRRRPAHPVPGEGPRHVHAIEVPAMVQGEPMPEAPGGPGAHRTCPSPRPAASRRGRARLIRDGWLTARASVVPAWKARRVPLIGTPTEQPQRVKIQRPTSPDSWRQGASLHLICRNPARQFRRSWHLFEGVSFDGCPGFQGPCPSAGLDELRPV